MVFHPYMGYQGKSDQVTRATSPQNWNEHELDNFPRVFIYSPLFDYVVHNFFVNIIEDFCKRRSILRHILNEVDVLEFMAHHKEFQEEVFNLTLQLSIQYT